MKSLFEKKCKCKGRKLAFIDPVSKIKIFAGGWTKGIIVNKGELAISLLNEPYCGFNVAGITPKYMVPTDCIMIDWPDYYEPNLTKLDWHNLVNEIRHQKKNVVIYCAGGHGRTGTSLAILAYIMGVTKSNSIEWVRKNYCLEAVESRAQVDYINYVLETEFESKTDFSIDISTQQGSDEDFNFLRQIN